MHGFPHIYKASATAPADGNVAVDSPGLATLTSAPPAEFGGPGDKWSPETMLVAAMADCFILTFRAIARASNLAWSHLECQVEGTLDRVERSIEFTEFQVAVTLRLPPDENQERAHRLLEKAERSCLITNSLKAVSHLAIELDIEG